MQHRYLVKHLKNYRPQTIAENSRFAAVALVLLMSEAIPHLFLIKRTRHPDDPWSGQIGLPGGHQEHDDRDLIHTAMRETEEETNILLSDQHLVCQIDDQQGYACGGKIDLTVRPFVFVLDQKPEVKINYELDRYFWLPIDHFQQSGNHIYFNPLDSYPERPGIQLDQSNILWGMTYRILTDFFTAAKIDSLFVDDYTRI